MRTGRQTPDRSFYVEEKTEMMMDGEKLVGADGVEMFAMDPSKVQIVTASKTGVAYVGLIAKDKVPASLEDVNTVDFMTGAAVLLGIKAQVPGQDEEVELHLVLMPSAAAQLGIELMAESACASRAGGLDTFKERTAAERAGG